MSPPIVLEAHGWRVQCNRNVDRFDCQIDRWSGDAWIRLVQSLEGDTDEPWPPSPPIQQLVLDQLGPNLPALLGVGMAGSSHWSISIHVDPSSEQLILDSACRCKAAPGNAEPNRIGTTFQVASDIDVSQQGERLLFERQGTLLAILNADTGVTFCSESGRISIACKSLDATARWKIHFSQESPRTPDDQLCDLGI